MTPLPPPPALPDLAQFGPSRVGRRRRRQALDRYYTAQRRYEGRPAVSGPPIPGSHRTGRRQFYTLEQARAGGLKSGEARRIKAAPLHREIKQLRNSGLGCREIARRLGCAHSTVSRLLRGVIRTFVKLVREQYSPPRRKPSQRAARGRESRMLALIFAYIGHITGLLRGGGLDKRRRGLLAGHLAQYQRRRDRYMLAVQRDSLLASKVEELSRALADRATEAGITQGVEFINSITCTDRRGRRACQ